MRFPHCARLPESSHAFTTLSSSFKKQKHFTSAFTVFLLMTVAGSFTNSLPAQESANNQASFHAGASDYVYRPVTIVAGGYVPGLVADPTERRLIYSRTLNPAPPWVPP